MSRRHGQLYVAINFTCNIGALRSLFIGFKVPPPTCDPGAGSANLRTIGYYQASNTRNRLCNRISPANIDVEGLTHLYFAFAKISPTTYSIVPDNPTDVELYRPFTKLRGSTLQTWIAIGGFDFSDPGPTRFTW